MDDRDLIVNAAEKVMGWKVCTSGRGSTVAFSSLDEDDRILATTHPWESVEWNPLESIADAWMLVERLIALDWQPTLICRQFEKFPEDRYGMHGCRLVDQKIESFSAKAETMPRAIVLAALGSCGVEM